MLLPCRSALPASQPQPQPQLQSLRNGPQSPNIFARQRPDSSNRGVTTAALSAAAAASASSFDRRAATPAPAKIVMTQTATSTSPLTSVASTASSRRAAAQPLASRRATPSVAAQAAPGPGDASRVGDQTDFDVKNDDINTHSRTTAAAASGSSDSDGGAAAAVAGHRLLGMSWKVCGGGPAGAPMLSPDEVTLSPDPPHHGRTLAIDVSGTNPISTPGGRLRVAVAYMGFKVYTYESALCDAIACPLVAGSAFRLQVSQKLPALAPPGPYSMEITGEDDAGVRFMCVQLSFQVTLPQPGITGGGGASSSREGREFAGGAGWGGGQTEEEE
ncbi:hypothetical protein PLESTF_000793100 [Pleodorina starrii]|nr:hypothetical protein PLESTF_000793100 [Pleodorina starrii]